MRWLTLTVLLCAALPCCAQGDGGGRDLSVALFSAQPPRSVVVSATGPGAWWALCATCRHQPLTAPVHMPAVKEMIAGGPLAVRDEEHAQVRNANGGWHLRANSRETVDVVLTLPSERYVAAVLMGETSPGEPTESLRAMAVVARTFVLRLPAGKGVSGHLASDVCDSTACQAIKLGAVRDAVREAVRSTAGETLWFKQQRAYVFFSGSCGGTTESAGALWPKLAGMPYLRSIADPYCVRKDHASWHGEIPLTSLREIAAREGWRIPPQIASAEVTQRTVSQRARTIIFANSNGERASVSASSLRLAVGRSLGWNIVRSDAYDLRIRDGMLVLDGHGHGHGVGLCQAGATEMARAGKSYREILAFYFPGIAARITPSDEGWQRSSQDGINFTSAATLTPAQKTTAVNAWKLAMSRFPLRHQATPTVIFAPTTEMFRQMTSQPGWQLASTSGATVVLQPNAVFAANHTSVENTLQHEMLHVAVEAGASAKAPLWLREGLVEVLAGDAVHAAPALTAAETERLLQNAASRSESEAAHHASAARTGLLIQRYGMSIVRGWLTSGATVPAD